MNYYERHIGDYLKDTSHLSLLEHGVYARLLDVYYSQQAALPADKVVRLIAARTKDERAALDAVLNEFFTLVDGAWHQRRCDEEIARFLAGEPEREVKRANEDNRLKRHREERSRLFKTITDAGQHASWNAPIADLREQVKRITATAPETFAPPLPATAPATPATATQTPYPDTIPKERDNPLPTVGGSGSAQNAVPPTPPPDFDGNNAEALNGKAVVPIAAAWELPEAWGVDAEALGWKPAEVLREAEKFRQYWVSGNGAGKRRSVKGWRQTWSNWLAKAAGDRR